LALGTRERRKNLPCLVEAFGLMAGQTDDLTLVLAGPSGNDDDAIFEQITVLPSRARERVQVLDWVPEETRRWLLHNALVLAYPSVDEGFGFPVLEAMSAGAVVVASTAGSIPEVAGDAALLVSPEDVVGLAAALDRAVDDRELRDALMARGAVRTREFSWAETARKMSDLYHSLSSGADS
jgi:glycosyltransferase involved in cell wall biosynthesis